MGLTIIHRIDLVLSGASRSIFPKMHDIEPGEPIKRSRGAHKLEVVQDETEPAQKR
jgi:hypothetical protein